VYNDRVSALANIPDCVFFTPEHDMFVIMHCTIFPDTFSDLPVGYFSDGDFPNSYMENMSFPTFWGK
jgi:hypothetical protein